MCLGIFVRITLSCGWAAPHQHGAVLFTWDQYPSCVGPMCCLSVTELTCSEKVRACCPVGPCVDSDSQDWKGFADHTHHCATGNYCRFCLLWTWIDQEFCYDSCSGLQRGF